MEPWNIFNVESWHQKIASEVWQLILWHFMEIDTVKVLDIFSTINRYCYESLQFVKRLFYYLILEDFFSSPDTEPCLSPTKIDGFPQSGYFSLCPVFVVFCQHFCSWNYKVLLIMWTIWWWCVITGWWPFTYLTQLHHLLCTESVSISVNFGPHQQHDTLHSVLFQCHR